MKNTKQKLFETMEKLNPDFKSVDENNIEEVQPTTSAKYGQQPDVQYADNTYKMIAPALKLINSPEKFAGAFKGWFQYLGYSPQAGNINIQRVRMDVENVMKELGYK